MIEQTTHITIPCRICKHGVELVLPNKAFQDWQNGLGLIQNLMPHVSTDHREMLITQICGDCFKQMFPPEEEDATL